MLPARPQTARSVDPGISIEPGTWWRLVDADHELNLQTWSDDVTPPSHGIVLLVEEVRIIDGEIHTMVLHGHPGWKYPSKPMLLAADFFQSFTAEPEGEMLRAQELAWLMDGISLIGKSMSDIPDDVQLLEYAKREAKQPVNTPTPETSRSVAKVPAALLPGGDLAATQDRLEGEIRIMELRQAWIEERQVEMKSGWDRVTRYQNERAAASMAAISSRTKAITTALEKVHSMGLWLGDGIDITELVAGKSAPTDEPLHLMQRLLYLDEEIHTHSMLRTGFTADDMPDLGALLTENPDLVDRMMPHPRSVVITRIRRKSRELPFPSDWQEVFSQIEKKEADKLIQILVRDGERVVMITADQETSNAERLFPSRAEIDAIFSERRSYNHETRAYETRAITPHDIKYSEKRSKHDKRALFYRRFLLILWGAQEREGVFGPFVPAGTNWLEETVHSERFRFVHDEEEVLSDGRPGVHEWMAAANAGIAAGSQVLVKTSNAVDEDSLPTAWKYSIRAGQSYQTHYPANEFELLTAARQGALLIGKLPCTKGHYDERAASLKPLILRNAEDRLIREGALCIDQISSEELRYYIASRGNRESYLRWLGLFAQALPLVEAREAEERALADAVRDSGKAEHEDEDTLIRICRAVLQSKSNHGAGKTSAAKAVKILERLQRMPVIEPEDELVTIDQHGKCHVVVSDGLIEGSGLPIPLKASLRPAHRGGKMITPDGYVTSTMSNPIGSFVVQDKRDPDRIADIWRRSPAGLTLEADWTDLMKIAAGEMDYRVGRFFEDWRHPSVHMIHNLFKKSREHTFRNTTAPVETLDAQVVIGAVVTPEPRWRGTDEFVAYALVVSVDPSVAALKIGRQDLIEDFAYRTYKDKPRGLRHLVSTAERATDLFRLSAARLSAEHTFRDEMRVEMRAQPHPIVKPKTLTISSRSKDVEDRKVDLKSLEAILSFSDVRSAVDEELGVPALEALKTARSFIAPAAEGFLRDRGFLGLPS
ncbi:hypothetical protein KUV57_13790 [Epibacterium sp. DP7N7-1]|nr:hypothetical protein [Epibacterium sp. DP7N7-1]